MAARILSFDALATRRNAKRRSEHEARPSGADTITENVRRFAVLHPASFCAVNALAIAAATRAELIEEILGLLNDAT